MDVVRFIRALGLQCKCYQGEFMVDYRRKDPRYRPDTGTESGGYGTTYFTNDAQDALGTAKQMADWRP